jgi:hypothetical protein
VDAVLADNSARTKNVLADTLDALGNISVDTTTANRAYYDYLTANEETKVAALSNAVYAINATIDTAIAQRQAEGGDTSALTGLKMQMDGALSGGLETRSVHTVADHTVDALIALPREALSNAEYDSLMSAYRMFEANPSDANAASVIEAGKQALDSMDIAQMEQSGVLTQAQSRALAEVKAEIENIDSGTWVGDNGSTSTLTSPDEYRTYASEVGKRADLTIEQKVNLLQEAYHALRDGNRADVRCPADARFVKGFDKKGKPIYNWPKLWGFIRNSIKSIKHGELNLPNRWSRVGSLYGNSLSDIPESEVSYTNNNRALPDIENKEAEHQGTSRQDEYYFNVIDAIANNELYALNNLLNRNGIESLTKNEMKDIVGAYNDFIKNAKERVGDIADPKYGLFGTVASWIEDDKILLDGGAKQYTLPLSIQQMIDLGIFQNTRRYL